MKIFITILLILAIIMVLVGVRKKDRKIITISSISTIGLLVLYMFLFQL